MATAHTRSVGNYCIIADTSHNWNTSPGKPLIGQLRLVNLNLFLCVVCGQTTSFEIRTYSACRGHGVTERQLLMASVS